MLKNRLLTGLAERLVYSADNLKPPSFASPNVSISCIAATLLEMRS